MLKYLSFTALNCGGIIVADNAIINFLKMTDQNIITGNTEEEIWQTIHAQFQKDPDPLAYNAIIKQNNRQIILDIDIDLGGGFESGYETTTITSNLTADPGFKFAIHQEHFTDEIGKFFGMQDVVVGYEDFDKQFIVKTNDETKVKELFSDASLRQYLQSLPDFTLGITHHSPFFDHDGSFLEFQSDTGITDVNVLRQVYSAFYALLQKIDPS